jgi:hypothetical protein
VGTEQQLIVDLKKVYFNNNKEQDCLLQLLNTVLLITGMLYHPQINSVQDK